MSSNTRSGSKRPGLRSSTKLKAVACQCMGSKSKSKKSPSSRKNSLPSPVTVPITDVSKSDDADVAPLEVDSKKNGSLKFSRFENDKNMVDIPTNDTEISPLRSNRVRFVIQTKRKNLTVASESGTKRTKKYKENFDSFFEDNTKLVNSNHDSKLTLPPNDKNVQESSHVNEQSSTTDNIEAFDHHSNAEGKKESQATNANGVSDIVECHTKINKPGFVKSFDLIKEQESVKIEEHSVSEHENAELQQSQINGLPQSSVRNKKQGLNKYTKQRLVKNVVEKELNGPNLKNTMQKLCDISVENIDSNETNERTVDPEINGTDVKNRNSKLNKTDVKNTNSKLNKTNVKNTNSKLNKVNVKNTNSKLNKTDVKSTNSKLSKTEVSDIKLNEISVRNTNLELNETDVKNADSNGTDLSDKDQELCENSISNINLELDESDAKNIDEELNETGVRNTDLSLNETGVRNIDQELNETGARNTDSPLNETDARNIDLEFNETIDPKLSGTIVKNMDSELSDIVKNIKPELNGNPEPELNRTSPRNIIKKVNETVVENADQKVNIIDELNEEPELNLSCTRNIKQKFNNDSVKDSSVGNIEQGLNIYNIKNAEQEINKTDTKLNIANMEDIKQASNALNMENTNQELNIINKDQGLNQIDIPITHPDQESTQLTMRITNRELNKGSVENTDPESCINRMLKPESEFNDSSLKNIDENLNEHSVVSILHDLIESSVETAERLNSNDSESHMESMTQLNENNEETTEQLDQKKLIDCLVSEVENRNAQELKTSENKKYLYNFESIEENIYRFSRKNYKKRKEVRRLLCDCTWDEDEYLPEIIGCGEECLNRLLMIECGSRCKVGDKCSNKRFQKREYAKTEPFQTGTKGFGLKMSENVKPGSFIIEFVGELVNGLQFRQRVKQYARENTVHHYFMAISNDEIIDATQMGNFSRFINHSCDPNCETQKWTVNGELRVGFFAKRDIKDGEELTFDYKFQIYGREAQKCFCGAEKCKGYIGEVKPMLIDTNSGSKSTNRRKRAIEDRRREIFEDFSVEKEVEKLCENGCLRNREDTLLFARLMVRVEDAKTRQKLLDVILKTTEQACLRMFVDYHGLSLIWSWMVDGTDSNLRYKILEVLSALPVSNKTILIRSKVLKEVEKWSVVLPNEVSNESVEFDADNEDNQKHRSSEIVDLACKLLATWKLLKEAFRIPRVEEQKKYVSNIDADNVQPKDCGDVASPKLSDESKVPLEQTNTSKNKEEGKNRSSTGSDSTENTFRSKKNSSSNTFGVKQMGLNKNERRQLFAASVAQMFLSKQSSMKDSSKDSTPGSAGSWTPGTPNSDQSTQPSQERITLLPTPVFTEPPLSCSTSLQLPTALPYPPASQQLPSVPPPLIFPPPNISVPPPQLPFLGIPPPALPSAGPSVVPVPPSSSWPLDPSSSSPAMYRPSLFPPPATGMTCPTQLPPAIPPPYQSAPSTETGVLPFTPLANCQNAQFACPLPSDGTQLDANSCHPIPDENGYISIKIKLPTNWKAAGDGQGNIYFYHVLTRKTQWHPPLFADESQDDDDSTPTFDEPQDSMELSVKTSTSEQNFTNEEILDDSMLPSNWKSTKDSEGQLYYYNVITRETQWDPPPFKKCKKDDEDEVDDDANIEEAIDEAANSTPLLDEPQYPREHRKRKVSGKKRLEKEAIGKKRMEKEMLEKKQVEKEMAEKNRAEKDMSEKKRVEKEMPEKNQVDKEVLEKIRAENEVASLQEATTSQEYPKRLSKKTPAKEVTPPQEVTPIQDVTPPEELTPTLETTPILGSPFENSPSLEADSSLGSKKIKDKFKAKLSAFVIRCLSHYRKPTCKKGRIVDVTDFRYLARKLTHCLIHKELRHCKNVEDLHYSEIVRNKAHDFIEKYMSRYGPLYKCDRNNLT